MSEPKAVYDACPAIQPKKILFLDLAQAVVKTWDRSGYPWQVMVDGFGSGSGLGMPPMDLFTEVARDVVEAKLERQTEAEMRRLMRSRLYRKHYDFELHYEFTHGNQDFTERTDLLQLAVCEYLWSEIERQYVEPPSVYDDEDYDDEDEESDNTPEQLALSL